jgi:hypothetical protein
MKDIQKIKEFFSKPLEESLTGGYPHTKTSGENFEKITITEPIDDATKNKMIKNFRAAGWDAKPNNGGGITAVKKSIMEGNKEYFKPSIRKDKSNPNFLYVDITYPEGSDVLSIGGSKTMSGQEREAGAAKALAMGNNVAKKLQAKYNIEDIDVSDLKNGKVEVFAVSDDFIKMASPSLDEAKKSEEEDVLGDWISDMLKYKSYEEVKRILLNNLRDALMDDELVAKIKKEKGINEASLLDNYEVDFFHTKANVYANIEIPSENPSFEDDIQIKGTGKTEEEAFEDLKRNYEKYKKTGISEAKKEDAVDTITMDIPLFLRMLEYSREDASQDMDLHDVTEKANKLGKERGILSMEDYEEIVGAAEEIDEAVNLKASKLSSAEYQKAKKLKNFKSSDWKWNADEDLYTKVNEAELTEAYVPSNIKEFAKRKGVSSLVNKVAGWAEKVGAGIRGGTAIGMNYSTLILDMTYQGSEIRINTDNDTVTLYDEPVNSFPEFKSVYLDNKEEDNGLEERISEALNKINEELCPAGKAYIKRRQAAGEKSSAYLSGRGVKVCKGLMSGRKKKK